jgi:DNA-binding MarR family transcriptional regulator
VSREASAFYVVSRYKTSREIARRGSYWIGRPCRLSNIGIKASKGANGMADTLTDTDFQVLASFRKELRIFLQFSEAAAAGHGLAPQQYLALLAIRGSDKPDVSVGDLAEVLLLKPHSASELVSRLEKLDLVARLEAQDDARRRVITLTEKSKTLLNTLSGAHRTELRRIRPLLVRLLSDLG